MKAQCARWKMRCRGAGPHITYHASLIENLHRDRVSFVASNLGPNSIIDKDLILKMGNMGNVICFKKDPGTTNLPRCTNRLLTKAGQRIMTRF